MSSTPFATLDAIAAYFRDQLQTKKFILLYGYNGTGKTRLSTAFKDIGKQKQNGQPDTLYFNAFTEDLFSWDNDLNHDSNRTLTINARSKFFAGLAGLAIETRIRPLLDRYADFDFKIDTNTWLVTFSRNVTDNGTVRTVDNIKISRGEENIFIWCFFLAIVQLAIDDDGAGPYQWVKYIYIDDPISSLDEQNATAIATHLTSMIKEDSNTIKTVVSTHHSLFFNVLYNEFHRIKGNRFFLLGKSSSGTYALTDTGDTPFFHHVASLMELHEAVRSGQVFTHHFNMLRIIAEKTASFLGYDRFEDCIIKDKNDQDGILHKRLLNLLSHGKYSLYEPQQMLDENKQHFKKMLSEFTERFVFNPELFPPL
jgi:hypothetical protein